jgi:thioredoxin reductase (NADPH)
MCEHLDAFEERTLAVRPSSDGCQECLEAGGTWVHLRLCMTCGHVGCCDSSPSQHATRHFRGTNHPVVKSFEPGEDWAWCYADADMVDAITAFPQESPQHHHEPPDADVRA